MREQSLEPERKLHHQGFNFFSPVSTTRNDFRHPVSCILKVYMDWCCKFQDQKHAMEFTEILKHAEFIKLGQAE